MVKVKNLLVEKKLDKYHFLQNLSIDFSTELSMMKTPTNLVVLGLTPRSSIPRIERSKNHSITGILLRQNTGMLQATQVFGIIQTLLLLLKHLHLLLVSKCQDS